MEAPPQSRHANVILGVDVSPDGEKKFHNVDVSIAGSRDQPTILKRTAYLTKGYAGYKHYCQNPVYSHSLQNEPSP